MKCPRHSRKQSIATEDRRFYTHHGIDPIGLLRAVLTDFLARQAVQGGSTITQQLAKNLYLTSERSLFRKLHEAVLAVWLERHFSKDQLLELYPQPGLFRRGHLRGRRRRTPIFRQIGQGAEHLSMRTAGRSPEGADASQSGHMTARAAADRTSLVLANMVDAGYLTPEAAKEAAVDSRRLTSVPTTQSGGRYFADWVQDQLSDQKYSGDVTVFTTLDPKMQAAAEAAIARTLDGEGSQANVRQAALVAMTPDGAVRAMVGGRDYAISPFNRATQAQRQPGSAFKLFVYLTALERGISPDDRFIDRPMHVGQMADP